MTADDEREDEAPRMTNTAAATFNAENAFHAHLDRCRPCAERPFDMCEEGARLLEAAAYGAARSGPPMLATPDGRLVPQGGQEDRATWWTCSRCGFRGPHVGTDRFGRRACLGLVCQGVDSNPGVPRIADPGRTGGST